MSTFEKRLRQMCLLSPGMRLDTALVLADRDGEPVPFPEDRRNIGAMVVWAAQFPTVMDLVAERKYIHAIKEIRSLAPVDEHGRALGLREAKETMEGLRVL